MRVPLYVICCLCFATFNIVFNFCHLNYSVSWCAPLGVNPLWDSLCLLDLDDFFLSQVREVSSYYVFKYFLRPFLYFPSGTTIMQILVHLTLSQRSLKLFSVIFNLFFPLNISDFQYSVFTGCKIVVFLCLVSVAWWVRLVLEARAGFLKGRLGPRGFWGWCLPAGEWSWVLCSLVGRTMSRGGCGLRRCLGSLSTDRWGCFPAQLVAWPECPSTGTYRLLAGLRSWY